MPERRSLTLEINEMNSACKAFRFNESCDCQTCLVLETFRRLLTRALEAGISVEMPERVTREREFE